jgi:hypothetical protein
MAKQSKKRVKEAEIKQSHWMDFLIRFQEGKG